MSDMRIKEWIAIVITVLLAANIVVAVALYSSISKVAASADVTKELKTIEEHITALRMEKSVFGKPPYPIERYSLLYNRAISFLIIVVVLNTGITFWFYRRLLRKIEPEKKVLFDIREKLEAIKEMAATMSELDEKGKEALLEDIRNIADKVEQSLKQKQ
jgi:hypothetical protein